MTAIAEQNFRFDGGITPAVEDLAGVNGFDQRHGNLFEKTN